MTMLKNNFKNLIVLDLANNHFGDLNHAKKVVSGFSKIINKYSINCTIKFQFRDLDNFIHKDYKNSDLKYIKRFRETKLDENEFKKLFSFIKSKKIKTSCTPFDEVSIKIIEDLKFDYLKIASVSALDFSIHERAIKNKIPKLISTGGLTIDEIDKIVSFYSKKKQKFAIMHCVAIYPSKNTDLNLSVIENLIKRYPGIPIGWSTHENPNELNPSILAYAKGARIFEKHIGINSKKYKLNDYSITPELFEKWYCNLSSGIEILGKNKKIVNNKEKITLSNLQRGVYAQTNIDKYNTIKKKNVYFAIPLQKGQLSAIEFKNKLISLKNFIKDKPLIKKYIKQDEHTKSEELIFSYLHELKGMLNQQSINIGSTFDLEISHHKGIKNFKKVGAFLFNIINKEYAKKLIVMLPNQEHPSHHHKKKVESFLIVFGKLYIKNNTKRFNLNPGDTYHVNKNTWHQFKAGNQGCIFEEISTRSIKSDSYYRSKKLKALERTDRKTFINNWFSVKNILNKKV